MNNKTKIINGINVSECRYLFDDVKRNNVCSICYKSCKDLGIDYCYYKQLQHEKAGNEQLKEDLNALQQTYESCEKEYKALNKRYEQVHRAFHKQSVFIDNLQNVAKLNDYDKITEAIKEYYSFSTSNDVDEKGG